MPLRDEAFMRVKLRADKAEQTVKDYQRALNEQYRAIEILRADLHEARRLAEEMRDALPYRRLPWEEK